MIASVHWSCFHQTVLIIYLPSICLDIQRQHDLQWHWENTKKKLNMRKCSGPIRIYLGRAVPISKYTYYPNCTSNDFLLFYKEKGAFQGALGHHQVGNIFLLCLRQDSLQQNLWLTPSSGVLANLAREWTITPVRGVGINQRCCWSGDTFFCLEKEKEHAPHFVES